MNLSEILEDETKGLVIIYPGRFHPFHIGHGKVYKYLKQKYPNAQVFISTSGKVDGDRSPFTFEEKKKMMILAGVDSGAIVQCKSPYQSIEIVQRFDEDKTVVVFAVSEKDMTEEPRFDFSGGIKLKKNGEPAYMQKWTGLDSAETYRKHGYLATTPTFPFEVLGQEINSASQIRNMITASDDTKLSQILQDLYNITDVPQDIIEIFKRKIGNKETMNENWSEYSLSEFLIEIEHEEKTMKKGILKSISEGKSPHKKGTKKYNAHMAAIHAESIDEEFDRKVKEIVEANGWQGKNRYDFDRDNTIGYKADNNKTKSGTAWQGKNSYANEQHEQLEYIHHVLQECGDGNVDNAMVDQAIAFVEDIREQHFNTDGSTKSESVKVEESEERLYVCVHANTPKYEVHATSSYDAVKKAAKYWGLKSTAGIDAHLADVEHVAEELDDDALIQIVESNGIGDLIVLDEDGKLVNRNELLEIAPVLIPALAALARVGTAVYKYGKPTYKAVAKKVGKWVDDIDDYYARPQPSPNMSKAERLANFGDKTNAGRTIKFDKGLIQQQKQFQKNLRNGIKNEEKIKEWLEEDAQAEEKVSTLTKMQDVYKYNEDRNNHSENILMLAHAFGDRGEIKAIEGLLKTTKQQGYVTPEQSEIMYNSIHKKYIKELFPLNEVWPALAVAGAAGYGLHKYGKKFGKWLGKKHKQITNSDQYKAWRDLPSNIKKIATRDYNPVQNMTVGEGYNLEDKSVDIMQKAMEESILHYSDAKGTPKYKEGYKAARKGVKYDENPYSGAEKLQWSKGHNDFRADKLRAAGEPNYGARGQFENKR